MNLLPADSYRAIVEVMPILCVDLVIETDGTFLLLKRAREPLKGRWWVPGGRVLKGETMTEAAKRKAKEELGIDVEVVEPLGFYEGHFKKESGAVNSIHTVSIVVLARPLSLEITLDYQSSAWRFSRTLPRDFNVKPFRVGASK